MAAHYAASYRGKQYTKEEDFTFDTSSTAAADMELRIEDAVSLKRADVIHFLRGLIRIYEGGAIAGQNFPVK
jgi:hypothetical protein